MDEVETRELRYFVAVAEEPSFGRAAQRLGIAQPPLSRAIAQLERRLGVTLFDRTSRPVTLTSAGQVLLVEGRKALDAVAAAARRAQRAGSPHLVLAVKPGSGGGLLPRILARYEAAPGALPVDIAFSVAERSAMLRDGRADIALLHRPRADLTGIDTEDLMSERSVVLVPGTHPLAGKDSVHLADLRDDPLPVWPTARDLAALGAAPVESAGDDGAPAVRATGELIQLVAFGRLLAVVPESIRDRVPGGVVCVPVLDALETTLAIGWAKDSRSLPVAEFVRIAAEVAASPPERELAAAYLLRIYGNRVYEMANRCQFDSALFLLLAL
jgi:DNA-binding transcriptional LysR family regulator